MNAAGLTEVGAEGLMSAAELDRYRSLLEHPDCCIYWRPVQAVTAMSWPCLARSVAVLGEQARLSLCAQLAGVNTRKARTLAAGLADLAVLAPGEPVRFVHPVVAAPSRTR